MKLSKNYETNRLIIQNYTNDKLSLVSSIWFDRENGKYLSDPEEGYLDEKFVGVIQNLEDSPLGYFLIVYDKNKNFIGTMGLYPQEEEEYDLAYCVNKKYWNMGYGFEMVSKVKDIVKDLGGKSIIAEIAKDNIPSIKLIEKSGFIFVKDSSYKKRNMQITYISSVYKLEM